MRSNSFTALSILPPAADDRLCCGGGRPALSSGQLTVNDRLPPGAEKQPSGAAPAESLVEYAFLVAGDSMHEVQVAPVSILATGPVRLAAVRDLRKPIICIAKGQNGVTGEMVPGHAPPADIRVLDVSKKSFHFMDATGVVTAHDLPMNAMVVDAERVP
jgi:hypothetical protein